MRTRLLASAALLVVAALPASAQRRAPGAAADSAAPARGMRGPGGPGGPGAPMLPRGPGGSPAAMLARLKQPLNLTDDQVKRLEALASQQRTALEPNVGAMLRARADLADARKGEGDIAATKKALEKLAALRIDQQVAHLKAAQEARAILTADQREKLGGMRAAMRGGMMRRMRGGPGGPMGMRRGMGPMGPGGMMGPGGPQGQFRGRGPQGPGMGPGRPGDGPDAQGGDDDEDEFDLEFDALLPMDPAAAR